MTAPIASIFRVDMLKYCQQLYLLSWGLQIKQGLKCRRIPCQTEHYTVRHTRLDTRNLIEVAADLSRIE